MVTLVGTANGIVVTGIVVTGIVSGTVVLGIVTGIVVVGGRGIAIADGETSPFASV